MRASRSRRLRCTTSAAPCALEHVASGVVAADRAARFDRHARMAPDAQRELDHRMRVAHRGARHRSLVVRSRAPSAQCCGRAKTPARFSGTGVEQHGQLGDLHGHEISRILGHIGVFGEDGGDRIAHIAHALGRQHRLAPWLEPLDAALAEIDRRNIRNVGRGPHRDDRRGSARAAAVSSGDYPSMRMVRAQRCACAARMRESRCRPHGVRRPVTSGGSSSRSTDWPIHLVAANFSGAFMRPQRRERGGSERDGGGRGQASSRETSAYFARFGPLRHGRACPGHPRLSCRTAKTWMPGTGPGMTARFRCLHHCPFSRAAAFFSISAGVA